MFLNNKAKTNSSTNNLGIGNRQRLFIFIFEEILFFVSLMFLAFIRGQEPSIRGLEKFMDFGFINSILRSKYFPPLDMWLSADLNNPNGFPINYYYFGHLTGAFLIKLTNIKSAIGYNLILATIFAQGITLAFSITANIVSLFHKHFTNHSRFSLIQLIFFGFLGTFIVNLGGNLHTIYLWTTGYPNESPIPFWKIFSWYNPTKYWYPNATRFIPFTIHEFPSYSYVVADLHGHVFDIPFVLLTLAILFKFFIDQKGRRTKNFPLKQYLSISRLFSGFKSLILANFHRIQLTFAVFIGFLTAVHYMTNAFDGPIYLLLSIVTFLAIYGFGLNFILMSIFTTSFFAIFSLPFSYFFSPFVSGIGVNCSPDFLIKLRKIGPFIFEKSNCQVSPLWMLFVLWGFFLINFVFLLIIKYRSRLGNRLKIINFSLIIDYFVLVLFSFGTFLLIVPEFFYIKDIYPAHFRANTMFKLGYQAFIIMGIGSAYVFYRLKTLRIKIGFFLKMVAIFIFFLIALYPFFSFPSYYGKLNRPVELDGSKWLGLNYPEDKEIIDFININITNQPIILEAQGDSYTDYERISAYTGLPTVAGWWVHEWLWRGSADVVGKRIPDIVSLYESKDLEETKRLIKKYQIKYVIISKMEKQKYKNLDENKFSQLGKKIFESSNNLGALYQLN